MQECIVLQYSHLFQWLLSASDITQTVLLQNKISVQLNFHQYVLYDMQLSGKPLKDKSAIDVIDDKIPEDTRMKSMSYISYNFSSFPCGITYSNKHQNDVKRAMSVFFWHHIQGKLVYLILFSPVNHCWLLDRVVIQGNGDMATRFGLRCQNA